MVVSIFDAPVAAAPATGPVRDIRLVLNDYADLIEFYDDAATALVKAAEPYLDLDPKAISFLLKAPAADMGTLREQIKAQAGDKTARYVNLAIDMADTGHRFEVVIDGVDQASGEIVEDVDAIVEASSVKRLLDAMADVAPNSDGSPSDIDLEIQGQEPDEDDKPDWDVVESDNVEYQTDYIDECDHEDQQSVADLWGDKMPLF